ncbi:hypothetical protein TNCV_4722221 [Trichonephila clavipes]|uniref:Uncharacterized protein n=1 Tax=Trichonephila clavipes TaxID=2585209 RepID=A0A8X6W6J6_TRICX|nr:hypothetical protein TNCV_4722221 [Trichonephila clavipes]
MWTRNYGALGQTARVCLALDKCVQMWTRKYGALRQRARVCFGVLCANKKKEEVKRDFGDLPIRRSEGRVVNTPLVFKRVFFRKKKKRTGGKEKEQRKRTRESGRENGRKEEERRKRERGDERDGKRVGERESDARLEWKKGLSPEIGVKMTMNAGGVEYGNRN